MTGEHGNAVVCEPGSSSDMWRSIRPEQQREGGGVAGVAVDYGGLGFISAEDDAGMVAGLLAAKAWAVSWERRP